LGAIWFCDSHGGHVSSARGSLCDSHSHGGSCFFFYGRLWGTGYLV
jgi:hypothetical protein